MQQPKFTTQPLDYLPIVFDENFNLESVSHSISSPGRKQSDNAATKTTYFHKHLESRIYGAYII